MTGLVAPDRAAPCGWSAPRIEVAVVSVGWLLGGTVGFATLAYALAIGPLVHLFLRAPDGPASGRTEELVTV